MYLVAQKLINQACKIIVIQAENPDGDSLGSALALEEILSVLGKEVKLYCPVEIPKYLRYIDGWDRVESDFSTDADLAIIVDTTAELLLSKVLETPGARHFLESREVLVIDHHTSAEPTLSFNHTLLLDEAAAAYLQFSRKFPLAYKQTSSQSNANGTTFRYTWLNYSEC